MTAPKPNDRTPTADEIRASVDRMIMSDVFSRSPQLGAFLRFVVEAVLHGKADRIKAYTIGVEVLRRDTSFDPQLDPIVRVEATRLRRTIERYYSGPGAGDAIIVDLPRGSYVPAFRRRAEHRQPPPISWRVSSPGQIGLAIAAAGVLLALLLVAAAFLLRGQQDSVSTSGFSPMAGTPRPGNGMPALLVHRLESFGRSEEVSKIGAALFDAMQSFFPRFDTINILFEPSPAPFGETADYRLSGSLELLADDSLSVKFRLLDGAKGDVVWSGEFRRPAVGKQDPPENPIALELATRLFQPYGVIRSDQRAKHLASNAGDPRYRCIVEASESFRSFDAGQHASARSCLEQSTARHPDFDAGFSYLAAVYFREHQYGFAGLVKDEPALERALRSARHAIELKPESARAYQMLFAVLFGRRDLPAAFAAGEKAMSLNPADMTILSDYGGRLILVGEVARGLQMLRRASDHGAIRPSWYHFYLFLGNYLQGDFAAAESEANQITVEGYQLGYFARALAAAATGNKQRANAEIDRLVARHPDWRADPKKQLAKFVPAPEVVERLARDLAAAGLAGRR